MVYESSVISVKKRFYLDHSEAPALNNSSLLMPCGGSLWPFSDFRTFEASRRIW